MHSKMNVDPAVAPAVYFPQTCTHITHSFNNKGELRTALIAGDRLVILKQGVRIAESESLFRTAGPTTTITTRSASSVGAATAVVSPASPLASPPSVFCLCMCPFSDFRIRVVVATTNGVLLFEMEDVDEVWGGTTSGGTVSSADPAFKGGAGAAGEGGKGGASSSSSPTWQSVHGTPAAGQTSSSGVGSGTRGGSSRPGAPQGGGRLSYRVIQLPPAGEQAYAKTSVPTCTRAERSGGQGPLSPDNHRHHMHSQLEPSCSPTTGGANEAGSPTTPSTSRVRVTLKTHRDAIVAVAFVTEQTLCIVFDDEAVLVVLGGGAAIDGPGPSSLPLETPAKTQRGLAGLGLPYSEHPARRFLGEAHGEYGHQKSAPVDGAAANAGDDVDRIVWRSMGSYTALAVCLANRHVALALQSSTVVVFPSKWRRGASAPTSPTSPYNDPARGNWSMLSSVMETPVFSPTRSPPFTPALPPHLIASTAAPPPDVAGSPHDVRYRLRGGREAVLAERGLTASLGVYRIKSLEWHRVSTYTLLCVTCAHPRDGGECVVLYTVQPLPTVRRFCNVLEEDEDGNYTTCNARDNGGEEQLRSHGDSLVQLIPSGTIPLSYGSSLKQVPTALSSSFSRLSVSFPSDTPLPPLTVLTGLVPGFSRSAKKISTSEKLEFLHLERDGTVRTSSYRFGRQKHASFAKQRGSGLTCNGLLAPLMELYGEVVRIEVLPAWKNRPVELGRLTPQTDLVMNSQRYRAVLHFACGLVVLVMVDLTAPLYKVENFLTVGKWAITSLLPFGLPGATGEQSGSKLVDGQNECFVAALLTDCGSDEDSLGSPGLVPLSGCVPGCHGVALFSQRQTGEGPTVKLLTVSRFPPSCGTVTFEGASSTMAKASAAPTVAPPTATKPPPEDVAAQFMQIKCPDKVRMFPSLLKACNGDATRLLKQLTAKYGALSAEEQATMDKALAAAQPTSPPNTTSRTLSSSAPSSPGFGDDQRAQATAPVLLRGGCVTSDGVLLLLSAYPPSLRVGSGSGGPGGPNPTGCGGYLVLLPPVALESLAPVQSCVALGGVQVALSCPARVLAVPMGFPLGALSPTNNELCFRLSLDGAATDAVIDHGTVQRASVQLSAALSREVECEVGVEVDPGNNVAVPVVVVKGPLLYCDEIRLPLTVGEPQARVRRVLDVKGQDLVNDDTVVGVLVQIEYGGSYAVRTMLQLYGLPAVQSEDVTALAMRLEKTIPDVTAFFLGPRGEVVAVGEDGRVERWLRCFPESGSSKNKSSEGDHSPASPSSLLTSPKEVAPAGARLFRYVLDGSWDYTSGATVPPATEGDSVTRTSLTAVGAIPWYSPPRRASSYRPLRPQAQLIYSLNACDYLRIAHAPFTFGLRHPVDAGASSSLLTQQWPPRAVAQYHPDCLMQLIGMARWATLNTILTCVADAAKAELARGQQREEEDRNTNGASLFQQISFPFGSGPSPGGDTADHAEQHPFISPLYPSLSLTADGSGGEVVAPPAPTPVREKLHVASPAALAEEICISAVARSLRDRPLLLSEDVLHRVSPAALSLDGPEVRRAIMDDATAKSVLTGASTTSGAGSAFAQFFGGSTMLRDLTHALPQVTLEGLSSQAQLGLLCIVEALSAASGFSRSVDEAASRFFFFFKLNQLRRRLRLPESSQVTASRRNAVAHPTSILQFEEARTAGRNVTTASFLWAAMSDSQAVILSELFGPSAVGAAATASAAAAAASSTGGAPRRILWEQLEVAGVPFWVHTPAVLRHLAEQVGKSQYQTTQSITECALMYCVARKAGTLAALCKTQNNTKLQAFFSRNFAEEKHRAAASANAFAAVSKNMPLYGAAFFILAGDTRSAAQIILQRCANPSLALFVLRAASRDEDAVEELQWYRELRKSEQENVAPLDMWELTCLRWLTNDVEEKVAALQEIGGHPTAHPEVLSALHYAHDKIVSLAPRGDLFLSPTRELVCLMRLGRFCFARGLLLNSVLSFSDAKRRLDQLEASKGLSPTSPSTEAVMTTAAVTRPKMEANYASGTLAFRGFDDDDDDDDYYPTAGQDQETQSVTGSAAAAPSVATTTTTTAVDVAHASAAAIEPNVAASIRAELRYTVRCMCPILLDETEKEAVDTDPVNESPSIMSRNATTTAAKDSAAEEKGNEEEEEEEEPCGVVDDVECFVRLSGLFLAVVRQAPSDELMSRFTGLFSYLAPFHLSAVWCGGETGRDSVTVVEPLQPPSATPPPSAPASTPTASPPPQSGDTTPSLFVALLHLILAAVSSRSRHYVLANALLHVPLSPEELARLVRPTSASKSATVHPVTAFFVVLLHHMRAERASIQRKVDEEEAAAQAAQADPTATTNSGNPTDGTDSTDGGTHRSLFDALMAALPSTDTATTGIGKPPFYLPPSGASPPEGGDNEDGAGDEFYMDDAELVSGLFSWFSLFVNLRVLRFLRSTAMAEVAPRSPTTQRAIDAGILQDAAYAEDRSDRFYVKHRFALRLLLCCAMTYATARFNCLSEDTFARVSGAQLDYDRSLLTDPNGVFLETDREFGDMAEVLYAVLGATVTEAVQVSQQEREAREQKRRKSATASVNGSTTTSQANLGEVPNVSFLASSLFTGATISAPRRRSEDVSALLLELCMSQAELFWQLPTTVTTTHVINTVPFTRALREQTKVHYAAQQLLQDLDGDVWPAARAASSVSHSAPPSVPPSAPPSAVKSGVPQALGGGWGSSLLRRSGMLARSESPVATPAPSTTPAAPAPSPIAARGPSQVLCLMEASWLRRHHTHNSLREILLRLALHGNVYSAPLATDRLLLSQSSHGLTGVNYDRSSCDSIVWSSEAGTSVGHGFRELLAGDNEWVLLSQQPERNLATAAFSQGLSTQQQRLLSPGAVAQPPPKNLVCSPLASPRPTPAKPVEVPPTTGKVALDRRPRSSMAANARPSSHPHLPFFLSCHRDGHLDLYPFASSECVATFLCPRSYASTAISYSPNGYLFAVGLQDGSVVGWRFTAAAIERAPLFDYPYLFIPSGTKAVVFCGDRSSMVVAVGIAREPRPTWQSSNAGGSLGGPSSSKSPLSPRRMRADVSGVQASGGQPTAASSAPLSSSVGSPVSSAVPYGRRLTGLDSVVSPVAADSRLGSSYPTEELRSGVTSPLPLSSPTTHGGPGVRERGHVPASRPQRVQPTEDVGELLLLDPVLHPGDALVHCALPFLPEFAVYLTPLDAVLCASTEGYLAVYQVREGRLTVIGEVPLDVVLSNATGKSTAGATGGTASGQGSSTVAGGRGIDGGGSLYSSDAATSPSPASPSPSTSSRAARGGTGPVRATALAASPFDPVVALGTSDGFALLLKMDDIAAAVQSTQQRQLEYGDDPYMYIPPHPSTPVAQRHSEGSGAGQGGGAGAAGREGWSRQTSYFAGLTNSVLYQATRVQVAPLLTPYAVVEDQTFSPSALMAGLRDGKLVEAALIPQALRQSVTSGARVFGG